jgi:general secretion pathway protein M
MREWFNRLEPRERLTVSLGGGIAFIVLLYAIIWLPVKRDVARLHDQVESQRSTAQWMQSSATEVAALRGVKSAGGRSDGRPLLTLVEQTAKSVGLGESLNRVEPQGADRARVWLELASFDLMVRWLAQIQREHGVQAESAVVDPQEKVGRVNARLVLFRGGGK